MGSGKTSAAFSWIDQHPEEKIIYVTPYLPEINRVQANISRWMYAPEDRGQGKLDSLKGLLRYGVRGIACTHKLLSMFDPETEDLLRGKGYTLIVDEALEVIAPLNALLENDQKIVRPGDIQYLLEKNSISIDEYGNVTWLDNTEIEDFQFTEVRQYANTGSLLCVEENELFWQFPPRMFELFKSIYVLTYRFDTSVMGYYFKFHGLQYELASAGLVDGEYTFTPFRNDLTERSRLKPLINICEDRKLNDVGGMTLSLSSYKTATKTQLNRLRKHMNNHLKSKVDPNAAVKSCRVMWTTFKEFRPALSGPGYTYVRQLTEKDRALPEQDFKRLECFVPCSCRGTNDYRERDVLMYMVNRYPAPNLVKLFAKKGVLFDQNAFALSEMIQWIWRSAIRDGKPVHIYIPSQRMRTLLMGWLDGKYI